MCAGIYEKQGNSVAWDLQPTGSEANTTIFVYIYTVTPFKFAAIKVRGLEIMTYSWPFNFTVSYQNYFTVSHTNVVFSYTN